MYMTHVCIYMCAIDMYVSICMYIYVYMYVYIYETKSKGELYFCMIYVYIYVYIYIYIYIYISWLLMHILIQREEAYMYIRRISYSMVCLLKPDFI